MERNFEGMVGKGIQSKSLSKKSQSENFRSGF